MNCAHCNETFTRHENVVMVHMPYEQGVRPRSYDVHADCEYAFRRKLWPFDCPECKGQKQIATGFREERSCCKGGPMNIGGFGPFAGCEWCPDAKTSKIPTDFVTCKLCLGVGRLEKEPVPVTTVTGWKRAR